MIIVAGDFNARIGPEEEGDAAGKYVLDKETNNNGGQMMGLCRRQNLRNMSSPSNGKTFTK